MRSTPGDNFTKKLHLQFISVRIKLECLSLAGLVQCLLVRQGANSRVEHLKCASLTQVLFLGRIRPYSQRFAKDKHSSLLQTFINYGCSYRCNDVMILCLFHPILGVYPTLKYLTRTNTLAYCTLKKLQELKFLWDKLR